MPEPIATPPERAALPAMLCVADVDTRLACQAFCAACSHYVSERRKGERRATPRATGDRRVMSRL